MNHPITMADIAEPGTLFERSALMPRPARRRPGHDDHHDDHREASRRGRRFEGGSDEDDPDPCLDLTLVQRNVAARIHPQLPPTPMWGYDGQVPGPVIEVDADNIVQVAHSNEIAGTMPYAHVAVAPEAGGSMNDAGHAGASAAPQHVEEAAKVAALQAYTVPHLHGGPTQPDADGWPDNVIGTGERRRVEYEFPRETWPMTTAAGASEFRSGAGPAFWYHDHGMSVTRFNVYAGLAGMWLVRDPIEATLGLPTDERYEIPLVLMDRGLDTADGTPTGALTGALVHKTQTDVMECFAPVNLVNGLAWPRCEVRPRVHRLRIVNGANARTYRLHFYGLTSGDESTRATLPDAATQQIGTDGGLLGAAVDLPPEGLVLSPGERADLLVDFGLVKQAGFTQVVVYNSAPAPWGGSPLLAESDIWTPDVDGFRPIPQVLRFDLVPGTVKTGVRGRPILRMPLDPAFRRVPTDHHDMPSGHGHTVVALREEAKIVRDEMGMPIMDGPQPMTMPMLCLHELMREEAANQRGVNLHNLLVDGVDAAGDLAQVPAGIAVDLPGQGRLVSIGKTFLDAAATMIVQGSWHLWKVINLSPDTHPFHVHLTQFQATARQRLTAQGGPAASGGFEFTFDSVDDVGVEANEAGWKDTVRVNPGDRDPDDNVVSAEMVTILGCFARHAGKYVYHCHILEHEDTEMMRSFTVAPAGIAAFMDHGH